MFRDVRKKFNNYFFIPFQYELNLYRKRISYYAVFDGHSGSRASEYCASKMHLVLAEKFPKGKDRIILKIQLIMLLRFRRKFESNRKRY